jgi:hypothetical protein
MKVDILPVVPFSMSERITGHHKFAGHTPALQLCKLGAHRDSHGTPGTDTTKKLVVRGARPRIDSMRFS